MRILLAVLLLIIGCWGSAPAQLSVRTANTLARTVLKKSSPLQSFRPSLLRIKEKGETLSASAFVIETQYKGQKELWGVSAAHYLFSKPMAVSANGSPTLTVAAQGAPGASDIVLFELPSHLLAEVKPFSLSEQPARMGQPLHSLGFFKGSWHHEKNRTVQEVSPLRIVTSLKVNTTAKKLLREGACGGPILNNHNEVVGIHVGSCAHKQEGYFVPVQHIKALIIAYHQLNESAKPLLFNGHKIGSINVNESITAFLTKRKGQVISHLELYHKEKRIDYNHLETLVSSAEGSPIDEVVFVISQYPLSPSVDAQKTLFFLLSYNLQSGQITNTQVCQRP